MNFQDKYIGIIGLGKSGYWSAKLARSLDYNVFISDRNIEPNHPYVQDLEQLNVEVEVGKHSDKICLLYTSPSPRDRQKSRMPSSA